MGRPVPFGAVLGGLVLAACGGGGVDEEDPCLTTRTTALPSVDLELASLDGLGFDAFVEASYGALLRRDPEALSELGLSARFGADDSQLTSLAASDEAETARLAAAILTRLLAYDRGSLPGGAQRTYDVYRWQLEDMGRQQSYADYVYPVTSLVTGVQVALLLFLEDLHPVTTAAQAEGLVNRVCQSDRKITELIAGLDRRAAQGLIAPRRTLDRALYGIAAVAAAEPTDLSLYRSFAAKVNALVSLDEAQRERLKARAHAALARALIPAYERLRLRLVALRALAPEAIGVDELQGGDAFYAAALRHYTTTTRDATAIAALGTSELERIHAEMRSRFAALGYPSGESLKASYDRVIVDGGSLSGAAVAAGYESLLETTTARLPEAFVLLPRAACTVVPVAGGGFYVGPSIDGSRPGAFYAPTSGTVPRYGMPTLAYH